MLPEGAKLMKVFDEGCVLTEGVAAGHDGFMYFSDITFTSLCKDESGKYLQAGNIFKYDPQTGETTVFRSPSGMSNGLKFDADGNLIAALGADYGGRMLVKTDMETGRSYILTGLYDGKPYNSLNDVTIDEQGRIYFSDPRYLGHEPLYQPGYAVYRLDPDGTVERIITDGGKTNGVLVSPDQQTLYVVSNDDGWFDFQRLKQGEQPPAGASRAAGLRSRRRRHGQQPARAGRLPPRTAARTASSPTSRATSMPRSAPRTGRASPSTTPRARSSPSSRPGRAADQCRLRPRRGEQRALRHLGQEPVQDPDGQGRLSAAIRRLRAAGAGAVLPSPRRSRRW